MLALSDRASRSRSRTAFGAEAGAMAVRRRCGRLERSLRHANDARSAASAPRQRLTHLMNRRLTDARFGCIATRRARDVNIRRCVPVRNRVPPRLADPHARQHDQPGTRHGDADADLGACDLVELDQAEIAGGSTLGAYDAAAASLIGSALESRGGAEVVAGSVGSAEASAMAGTVREGQAALPLLAERQRGGSCTRKPVGGSVAAPQPTLHAGFGHSTSPRRPSISDRRSAFPPRAGRRS